jgi:hypothetical protein
MSRRLAASARRASSGPAEPLDTNRVVLDQASLDGRAVVLAHAPEVRAWTSAGALYRIVLAGSSRTALLDEARAYLR